MEKEHWREIIAAGFAAGTAANFGAPIGGVLFSIEVTATHYPVSSYVKAFVCSVSGAFCFRLLGGAGAGAGREATEESGECVEKGGEGEICGDSELLHDQHAA